MATDLLKRAMSWLADKLEDQAAGEVTYARGGDSVTLRAVKGSTLLQLGDDYGATWVERTDRDFVFRAADLVLGGELATPERNDTVTETDADRGEVYTYEVLAPGNEPPWRWSDPHRQMVRVHCKLKSTGVA